MIRYEMWGDPDTGEFTLIGPPYNNYEFLTSGQKLLALFFTDKYKQAVKWYEALISTYGV